MSSNDVIVNPVHPVHPVNPDSKLEAAARIIFTDDWVPSIRFGGNVYL